VAKRTIPGGLDRAGLIRWLILDAMREVGRAETVGALSWMAAQRIGRLRPRAAEIRAELARMEADGLVRAVGVEWLVRMRDGRSVVRVSPGYELAEGGAT